MFIHEMLGGCRLRADTGDKCYAYVFVPHEDPCYPEWWQCQ